MPMRQLSPTVQPAKEAAWPTETFLPIVVADPLPFKVPTLTPSCRLVPCPICTG
jgi:hypothetical protein